MKTLKEVKEHVSNVGYNQLAIQKIEGYLLGNGLLGEEFEMEYMIGLHDFDDFMSWFNRVNDNECMHEIDWGEFGLGDYIHIQAGIDVILLGRVQDGKIVCFSDGMVAVLQLTDESRPCNEEEIKSICQSLNKLNIKFCFENDDFIPASHNECECNGCEIDNLELKTKEAIEKIFRCMHKRPFGAFEEEDRIIDSFEMLIALSEMYE